MASPQPLVSVAIATFNGERYLRQQLDSIYAQTLQDLEVVVSDDASTDSTPEILREFSRTRGLRFELGGTRLGLVRNFERALRLCRGRFVALCDQDDIWKVERLQRLVDAIGDAALVYCSNEEQLDASGRVYFEQGTAATREFSRLHGSGRPTKYLLADNWIVSHSMFFRRDILEIALPIPEGLQFHDGWLALAAATAGEVRYLDERLQIYRNHPHSYTYRDPAEALPRGGRLARLLRGALREGWRRKQVAESARLDAIAERLTLDEQDRRVLDLLRTYFRPTTAPWAAALAGWAVAPYFSNEPRSAFARARIALRPLAAGVAPRRREAGVRSSCAEGYPDPS